MKSLIFKAIIVLVLVALVVVGLYYLVSINQWPWWAAVAIGLGLAALLLGILFLRKWLFRRSEKNFVKRITEDDTAFSEAGQDQRRLQLLEERWKEAVSTLRRSRLKKHGKPLYVLPWYLIIGESGSGKTAAIKGSRLHSALTDISQAGSGSGTKNCDWWFFEKAIVLDTAGRYTIPVDELQDKAEWHEFLLLLTRYRRKEPINGLIVTIGADKLLHADPDALADNGRMIRRRIDELMRAFGARFPVYIMITKLDQVLGLTEFSDLIPEGALNQALGEANPTMGGRPDAIAEKTIHTLSEKLKDLRFLLYESNSESKPVVMLLPGQINRLKSGLTRFVSAVFEKNPYQEPPAFRGIYFSSARQEPINDMLPGVLSTFHLPQDTGPATYKGLFLRDFFGRVLPEDRNLLTPIAELVRWRKLTRNLGFLSFLAFMLFLTGLISLSFFKNLGTINTFRTDFSKSPTLVGDMSQDFLLLSNFHSKIVELASLNEDWFLPRMGLDGSLRMEEALKEEYCRLFRQGFLGKLDQKLKDQIERLTKDTPEEAIATYVEHLGTRVGILTSALEGNGPSDAEGIPPTLFTNLFRADANIMPELTAKGIRPYYFAYLEWNPDPEFLEQERGNLMTHLSQMATSKGIHLYWLTKWANIQDIKPVTRSEFWAGRLGPVDKDTIKVTAAYTKEGRKRILDFINQFESAMQDPEILKDRKAAFFQWYRGEYIKAWEKLGEGFKPQQLQFENKSDWIESAQSMGEKHNPYLSLLDKMNEELAWIAEEDENQAPAWINMVSSFKKVRALADKLELGDKAKKRLPKAVDSGDETNLGELERMAKEADRLKDYVSFLKEASSEAESSDSVLRLVSQTFSTNTQSPLYASHTAYVRIERLYPKIPKNNLYLRLLKGPWNFMMDYAIQTASSELQSRWDANVLAEIQDVPESKRREILFDKSSGVVWNFVKGPAAPFLKRGPGGYTVETALGHRFPLQQDFLLFINKGASQTQMLLPEYEVTFSAMPTSVDRGALLEPHSTVLTLECMNGTQRFENLNFPIKQKFKWEPDNCGDVSLTIHFRDFSVTKKYTGPYAFPKFISMFNLGSKTFTADDFPDKKNLLRRIRVKNIKIKYAIKGGEPLNKLRKKTPVRLPKKILLRRSMKNHAS